MLILEILIYALVNCGFSDFASLEIPLIILVIDSKIVKEKLSPP